MSQSIAMDWSFSEAGGTQFEAVPAAQPSGGGRILLFSLAADRSFMPAIPTLSRGSADCFWVSIGSGQRHYVEAHLEIGPGPEFILTNTDTGIFGVGGSLPEAVMDFRLALREHLDVLDGEDVLSVHLEKQRAFLRRHLVGV